MIVQEAYELSKYRPFAPRSSEWRVENNLAMLGVRALTLGYLFFAISFSPHVPKQNLQFALSLIAVLTLANQIQRWIAGYRLNKLLEVKELRDVAQKQADSLHLSQKVLIVPVRHLSAPYRCWQLGRTVRLSAFAAENCSPAEIRYLIARAHFVQLTVPAIVVFLSLLIALPIAVHSINLALMMIIVGAAGFWHARLRLEQLLDEATLTRTRQPSAARSAVLSIRYGPESPGLATPNDDLFVYRRICAIEQWQVTKLHEA